MNKLVNWYYGEKLVSSHDDLPTNCTDIVYEIIYESGMAYIGKKTVRSMSVLPKLKTKVREGSTTVTKHVIRNTKSDAIVVNKADKVKARDNIRKAKKGIEEAKYYRSVEHYEKVLTNKPFIEYSGSSKLVHKDDNIISKTILFACSDKISATYLEAKLLFFYDAPMSELFYNANILGKFFDNSLDGLIQGGCNELR